MEHHRWLNDNLHTAAGGELIAHLGEYSGDDQLFADRIVEATQTFVSLWYPQGSRPVPRVAECIRLTDVLPFTHSVHSSEESTAFGLASSRYSMDLWRICNNSIPTVFPGSGNLFSFVLPCLNKSGTKAFTRTPRFHPHESEKVDLVKETIWEREHFSTADQWNIGRVPDTSFPSKEDRG